MASLLLVLASLLFQAAPSSTTAPAGPTAPVPVDGVPTATAGAVSAPPTPLSADPEPRAPTPVQVRVEGIRGEMRAAVLAQLRIAREARTGRPLSEGEVNLLHLRAPDQVRSALEPFGHYRPEISATLEDRGGAWRATYRVDPGRPVTFRNIDVRLVGEGSDDPALREAVRAVALAPGQPLRHSAYEQAKRRLQAAAVERGFLDAGYVENVVAVRPEQGRADVTLRLDTGPRFRFGPVRFVGADLDEDFLLDFIRFAEGEPVATPILLDLQNTLQATGLFTSVEVGLLRDQARELVVPVEVRLSPRPRTRLDAGVGYGTDTGPRAVVGVDLRRLNRYGHGLETELRTSFIQNGLNARYLIPLPGTAGDRIRVSAGLLDERTLDIRSTRGTLGVGWHRSRGRWREAWLLDLQRERYGEGDELTTSNVVLPSVQWSRTEADDPVHALRGRSYRFEVAGSHKAVGSPSTFGRISAGAGLLRSPWRNGRVIVRAEAGTAFVGEASELPVSQRFYAGGDRSVRGYAYRFLAPRSEEGIPVGGKHLIIGSAEVEHLFWNDFGLAAFVDAGNAGDDWPVRPQVGTGLGLRWLSPVGMVGLDAAAAVSRPGTPWRIHLSIGGGL